MAILGWKAWFRPIMLGGLLFASLSLGGCSSSDGSAGPAGPPGPAANAETGTFVATIQTESCGVCHFNGSTFDLDKFHKQAQRAPVAGTLAITGASVAADGAITVNFIAVGASPLEVEETVANSGVSSLIRVSVLSLRTIPADGQQVWRRDVNRANLTIANLTSLGGNNFSYLVPDFTVQDTSTHRVNFEWGYPPSHALYNERRPVNAAFDFVPPAAPAGELLAAAPAGASKRTVPTAACLKCHDDKKRPGSTAWNWFYDSINHDDTRVAIENCNICHNLYGSFTPVNDNTSSDYTAYATFSPVNIAGVTSNNNSPLGFNMHRRHSQSPREDGTFRPISTRLFYPLETRNCQSCHFNDGSAPEADKWKTNPSRLACGGCHVEVNFATGAGHSVGIAPQSNDLLCTGCHTPESIERAHAVPEGSPGNPLRGTRINNTFVGLADVKYEIAEVTANAARNPVIRFRIIKNDLPVTINAQGAIVDADLAAAGPGFLVAYSLPQDGRTTPADWNQLGRTSGQPQSVNLAELTGITTDADGWVTATISTAQWPVGASLRAVGMQGAINQITPQGSVALRIPSLVQAVGGEERRSPLSIKRCLECHDTLVYHDGTHVLGYTYDQYTTRATARVDNICLICHNPNLSSSGRGATLTGAANQAEVVALLGGNPLLYPEASLNLKDMLHGVHGTANPTRTVPLEFVSDRGTNGLFYSSFINRSQKLDFPSGQIVGYPGNLTNCTKCHAEGFGVLDTPDMALLSTWKTTDGVDATPAAVVAARAGMPNATDLVVAPVATACYACHNNDPLRSHIRLMGGGGFQQRNQVTGAQ